MTWGVLAFDVALDGVEVLDGLGVECIEVVLAQAGEERPMVEAEGCAWVALDSLTSQVRVCSTVRLIALHQLRTNYLIFD